MATAEPVAPSRRRLRAAARAERERVRRELDRVHERMTALRVELDEAERLRGEFRQRLALLARLARDADQDSALRLRAVAEDERRGASLDVRPAPLGALRGADIRVAAVRVLASSERPVAPIHYTRWYEFVREAGYGIGGREPLSTFLAQITRSPLVERAGAPGTYALDLDAPARLRERLRALGRELAQLHDGQQTLETIASEPERLAELAAEYERVERALAEAVEALGEARG